jgi:hypothetical protein
VMDDMTISLCSSLHIRKWPSAAAVSVVKGNGRCLSVGSSWLEYAGLA